MKMRSSIDNAIWRCVSIACLLLCLGVQYVCADEDRLAAIVGQTCNVTESKLLVASNQLMTDCGYLAWCDPSTNRCAARGCRKDEFPFGYNTLERSKWPKLCSSAQFCPDEGSACMDKVALGGGCQLNRDDECATPSVHQQVRCLQNVCTSVNATKGAACIHENVVYTTFTPDNSSYGSIVSRDNCQQTLYCDSVTDVCLERKAKGAQCSADKECQTDYCQDGNYTPITPDNNLATGMCADQPHLMANRHRVWVYPVVFIVALIPLVLLITALIRLHARQGAQRRGKLRAYWDSQRLMNEKARVYKHDLRSAVYPDTPASGNSPLLSNAKRMPLITVDSSGRTTARRSSGQGGPSMPVARDMSETSLLTTQDDDSFDITRPALAHQMSRVPLSVVADDHEVLDTDGASSSTHEHARAHDDHRMSTFVDYHGHHQRSDSNVADMSAVAVEEDDHNVPINHVSPFDAAEPVEQAGFYTPHDSQQSLGLTVFDSTREMQPHAPPSSVHASTSHRSALNAQGGDVIPSSSFRNRANQQMADWSFNASEGHKR